MEHKSIQKSGKIKKKQLSITSKYNCNYIGDKYAYSYDWYQDI